MRQFSGGMTRRTALQLLSGVPLLLSGLPNTLDAVLPRVSRFDRDPHVPAAFQEGGTLDLFLKNLADEGQFSGSMLVASGERPVFTRAYGLANEQQQLRNRLDNIYLLASTAKTFTGVALAQLVQHGKLSFQDPVGKYLNGFSSEAGKATIHQLLTHTAGFGDVLANPVIQAEGATWTSDDQEDASLLAAIREEPLQSPPGTRFQYSNSGYMTLGAVVAQIADMNYRDYYRQHIFRAAGMHDTDFYTRPQLETLPHFSRPYHLVRQGSSRQDVTSTLLWTGTSAGDAGSTVLDMLRFSRALQEHRLLNAEFTDLVITGKVSIPAMAGHQSDQAGYGFADSTENNTRIVWHNGGAPGRGTQLDIYPSLGWTDVILTNFDPNLLPPVVTEEQALITTEV